MIFTLIPHHDSVQVFLYQFLKKNLFFFNYPTFEAVDDKLILEDCKDLLNLIFCSLFNSEYNLTKKL